MTTRITTHVEDGIARLLSQFKRKILIEGFIASYIAGYQELEDVGWDILDKRKLGEATGQQLDNLGSIVGEERKGRNDDDYEIAIIGRIGINTSKGRAIDLITIFKLLTGSERAHVLEAFPAECFISGNVVPTKDPELLADGDMETPGVAEWIVENNALLSKNTSNPYEGTQALRVEYNGTNNPGARQNFLVPGNWYRISGYVRMQNISGPIPAITSNGGAQVIYSGFPFASWYEFDVVFQATASDLVLGSNHTSAGWLEYDDVSVKEIDFASLQDIFEICDSVIGGGIKLIGIGFYDEEGGYFSFSGDPNGLGFSGISQPDQGGKFAGLFAT